MIRSVGVVVPAHDEEGLLEACLTALRAACRRPGLPAVRLVVVADSCSDATARVARRAGAEVVEIALRSPGAARAAGFDLLARTCSVPLTELWLATTDADSRVPEDWLSRQLEWAHRGWDAVVGTVVVEDWAGHSSGARGRYAELYGAARDDHPHVHGANLGLSGDAYRAVGGFPPVALAEDHALVAGLVRCGLRVARRGTVPVVTSARREARAAGGFGDLLTSLQHAS